MQWIKTLGCGVSVYLVMAACAATDKAGKQQQASAGDAAMPNATGGDAPASISGASNSGAPTVTSGAPGSGMGGMTDPIPDVMAQEPKPPVVIAKKALCDKMTIVGGTTPYMFAEADFPGYTKEELARKLTAMLEYNPEAAIATVPGYTFGITLPYIKDGSAAFLCGPVAAAKPYYLSVTFQLVE